MPKSHTESQPHSPELDGVRGLAILAVLCSHGATVSGIFDAGPDHLTDLGMKYAMIPMWGGVDLFFALSGFLITGILLRSKSAENYFSAFYARRILRIFPIYYFVLITTLMFAHFSSGFAAILPHPASWKISYFFYLQNWPIFWHGQMMMTGPWGAYWSLAAEEQFYLIWPLIIFLFREETVAQICYIGLACAFLLRIALVIFYFGNTWGVAHMTSGRADGLLIGSACAIYTFRHNKPVPIRWVAAMASIGATMMAYIVIFQHIQLIYAGAWMSILGITSFALLSGTLVAISQHRFRAIQSVLTLSWLRKLGKYSYGIYVYHLYLLIAVRHAGNRVGLWPHLNVAEQILVFLLEVGAAYLTAMISYELYESKFLRMKKRFEPRRQLTQAATLATSQASAN